MRADMEERGIEELDFVYIIGDAYVDHPSFGHAIISRILESRGYRSELFPSRTGKIRKAFVFRRTATGVSGSCRKYGFDGKSLFCIEKTKEKQMPIPQAERWENDRIMRELCMEI